MRHGTAVRNQRARQRTRALRQARARRYIVSCTDRAALLCSKPNGNCSCSDGLTVSAASAAQTEGFVPSICEASRTLPYQVPSAYYRSRPYFDALRSACAAHDACYATCNKQRSECDESFEASLTAACANESVELPCGPRLAADTMCVPTVPHTACATVTVTERLFTREPCACGRSAAVGHALLSESVAQCSLACALFCWLRANALCYLLDRHCVWCLLLTDSDYSASRTS